MGGIERYPGGGGWGAKLKNDYRRYYGTTVGFSGRGEMIPNEGSYCEIDPTLKDKYGIPVLRFHWKFTDHEYNQVRHMQQTFRAPRGGDGRARCSTHADARTGLRHRGRRHDHPRARRHEDGQRTRPPRCSMRNCQAHDVPNLFVADGGPFVSQADKNPTWTIMALAWRTSDSSSRPRSGGAVTL